MFSLLKIMSQFFIQVKYNIFYKRENSHTFQNRVEVEKEHLLLHLCIVFPLTLTEWFHNGLILHFC